MRKRIILVLSVLLAIITAIVLISEFLNKPIIKEDTHGYNEPWDKSFAINSSKKKTICLSMIVKNERDVIARCLNSVKGLVDHWVVVDTGSEDGTQEIIKECMREIPGTLYERPWVNFAHNRNEALALAKAQADYTLFIDADEILSFSPAFQKPVLDKDLYWIRVQQRESSDYLRWFLVNNALNFQWEGVIHEQLLCAQPHIEAVIENVVNLSETELGSRSKNPRKYLDDAEILLKELQKEPDNTRYQFYLAQAYANAGELNLALAAYQNRAVMEMGCSEEVFVSLFTVARIQEILGASASTIESSYLKAHQYTPTRPEPLFYLGCHYLRAKRHEEAYTVFTRCAATPSAYTDTLFVETDICAWKLPLHLAEVCWKLNKIHEMVGACEKVVNCEEAPESTREEMRKNIRAISGGIK